MRSDAGLPMIFYEANNINGFFENFDLTKIHFSLNEVEFSLSLSLTLSFLVRETESLLVSASINFACHRCFQKRHFRFLIPQLVSLIIVTLYFLF